MASSSRSGAHRSGSQKRLKYDLCISDHEDDDGVEDEVKSESRSGFALDPSGSYYKYLKDVSELPIGHDMVLGERLWTMLPEDIFDVVLKRLSLAARCRFRCVSRKWKGVVPLSQYPCTIMSRLGDGNAKFFCHYEQKWFRVPSQKEISLIGEVADVDAGFLCYQWNVKGKYWLCVCNPLTNSARVIPPDYPYPDRLRHNINIPRLKLIADQENKTFKVILVMDELYQTLIYDSTTCSWKVLRTHPGQFWNRDGNGFSEFFEFFVWKNVTYIYKVKQTVFSEPLVLALDREHEWVEVETRFPCKTGFPVNHFILSDKNQVLLVEFCFRGRLHFSMWKLLDNGSGTSQDFSLSKWEKVIIRSDKSIKDLMGNHSLGRVCYGTEYICFMFSDDKTVARKSFATHKLENLWNKCVKYSFATQSWDVMPSLPGQRKFYKLFPWEPNLDVDFKLEHISL